MRVLACVLFCAMMTDAGSLSAQCPDRDSAWNKISFLRNGSSGPKTGPLKDLLQYERQIKDCFPEADSVYTFLLLNIGVVYYRLADYIHAIQYTRRAIDIIHVNAADPAIAKTDLIRFYYYLSIYYDSLKLVSQKNEAIDSCISNEMKAHGDYHYASLVLQDNVRDLYSKGDYSLCADRSALGETLIHKFYRYNDSMNHIIYFIYYRANALGSLGKFQEEEQFLQSKKAEFLKMKNKDYTGVIYSLFGHLYQSTEAYGSAIAYFQKAFYYDQFSAQKEISAGVLSEIGLIYAKQLGQNKLALEYYQKALAHARYKVLANAAVSDSLYILGNIANVYVRMDLFDSAFYFFQKAFDKIKPGMNESGLALDIENYVNANTVETVINLVLDKADARLRQYFFTRDPQALQQALAIYKVADRLLDKIKDEQLAMQSRLFWQADTRRLYEHAVEASFLQNNTDNAFYFFEKSRATLLNEQLKQQSQISDSDILKQAQLKKKILLLEKQRDGLETSSNQYIEVQKELIEANEELSRLKQVVKQNNPLYYQRFFDESSLTQADVKRNLLKDQQALLELFEGDSAVYALLLTPGQTRFYKIDKADFDKTTKIYTRYISSQYLLNSRFSDYVKTANHLYRLIFPKGDLPAGRIIISPHGHYFPFESLVTSISPAPIYFLSDHAVSYTYSARYLMNDFSVNNSGAGNVFLGVAPVHYAADPSLADLQGSDLSLKKIGSNFGDAKILVNTHASRNNFLQQYAGYKVIQLYTHAADSSSNGEPVIHFADSSLYLSELIPEHKPITRLIVLSACETGNGKLYEGEGVFSFNRGFASLGIPSSISNLWAVDNETTYQLTEIFYKYLSTGMPIDIALQKAKLEFTGLSRENRLPYYWAATIVAGKTDAIEFGKTYSWKLEILAGGSIVGLSLLLLWGRPKRRKYSYGFLRKR